MTDPDRFVGTNPSPVVAGGTLHIKFENSYLANSSVLVEADNGLTAIEQLTITTDSEGKGELDWTVPATGWMTVNLNNSTSIQHTVLVTQPP